MEEVEKEILADHPIEVAAENEVMPGVAENVPTDPSPFSLPSKLFVICYFLLLLFFFVKQKNWSTLGLIVLSMFIHFSSLNYLLGLSCMNEDLVTC